jgi:hypothetical protein
MDTWLQSHLASVETITTAGFTPVRRGVRNGPVQFVKKDVTHAKPRAPAGSDKAVGAGVRYLQAIIQECKEVGRVYHVTGAEGVGKAKIVMMPTGEKATMNDALVREVAKYVMKM